MIKGGMDAASENSKYQFSGRGGSTREAILGVRRSFVFDKPMIEPTCMHDDDDGGDDVCDRMFIHYTQNITC